jgi:hypothetical protein
VLTISPVHSED